MAKNRMLELCGVGKALPKKDAEADSLAEMGEALVAMKGRQEAERSRMADATDGSYYLVVTFRDFAQRQEYLKKKKVSQLLDGGYFIDGTRLAALEGISLEDRGQLAAKGPKAGRWSKFTKEV